MQVFQLLNMTLLGLEVLSFYSFDLYLFPPSDHDKKFLKLDVNYRISKRGNTINLQQPI